MIPPTQQSSLPGINLDVVILGGGAAGLWLLDSLIRRRFNVVLLESSDLGSGQTISSQGIIHGGLKYTLHGLLSPAARAIREMPKVWRRCLAGEDQPDLSHTALRAEFCYMWHTDSMKSRLGMLGARAGLRITPRKLADHEIPDVFSRCCGEVTRLDEQVMEPASFLCNLASPHRQHLLKINAESGLEFQLTDDREVELIRLINPDTGNPLDIAPRWVVLTAGTGNQKLRDQLRLPRHTMQRRPLHMVVVRGELPVLNGHCVDGAATRLTITSSTDSTGRCVWQIGGQLAESGVHMNQDELINEARSELSATLPGINLSKTQWTTYRVDRAEATTGGGRRPDLPSVRQEHNIITAWPTKLALAPVLVNQVISIVRNPQHQSFNPLELPPDWPRPAVALYPWEQTNTTWISDG